MSIRVVILLVLGIIAILAVYSILNTGTEGLLQAGNTTRGGIL